MNRKFTIKNLIFLVNILFLAMLCCAMIPGEKSKAFAETLNVFEEQYMMNQTVQIPKEILSDTTGDYEAVGYIVTPSGNVYRKDEVQLSEEGIYTVIYKALNKNGVLLEKEYNFLSGSEMFSVNSPASAVETGYYLYGDYKIDRKALLASVVSKDNFTFRPIIDLSALKGESFLEFFVTPESIGTEDVQKIIITLTDVHDENNFVTLEIKKGEAGNPGDAWAELNSYITGNGVGQIPTGLETNRSGIVVDGAEYLLHKGDTWGANVKFALPGNPKYASVSNPNNMPEYVGTQTLAFSMDIETGAIYANGQLVTVLTNEEIYGKDIWSGFASGEVYLSIEGSGYNASSLNLAITKIGKLRASEGAFDENIFVDDEAPVIDVEAQSEPAHAMVGEPYNLFNASAYDKYDGTVPVKQEVYFGYGTGGQVRVNVKDNAFVPFALGSYTVKYISEDRYKNRSEVLYEVYADGTESERLSATIGDLTDGVSGKSYTLIAPEFENIRGDVVWRAEIKHTDKDVIYEADYLDSVFTPEYAGIYEVTYYYGDYVFSGEIKKELMVNTSDEPVIFGEPVLPKYIISGCLYELPVINGRIYASADPKDVVADIYVKEDGGAERKVNHTFVTYATEKIQIIYRITDSGNFSEYVSEEIPVIDVGYNGTYRIENYFYGDDFVAEEKSDRIRFSAKKSLQSAETEFINPLQTFDFSLRLAAAGNGFSKISVLLTDELNENITLKFSYIKKYGNVYFSINDGEEILLENVSFDNFDSPLYLKYENASKAVYPTGVSSLYKWVESDLNGNKFEGFSTVKAYVRIMLENIENSDKAQLDVININGQKISNIYMDLVKPQISAETASGERPQGTAFTINPVYFGDVLDPSAKCTMSVKAPDGSYVADKEGVLLEPGQDCGKARSFTLNQFGAYTVSYTAYDNAGNELNFDYVVWSVDVTKPTVKILSPITSGKAGSSVKIASIEVTDNYSAEKEDFTVYVCVVAPNMQSYSLTGNGVIAKSFTPKSAGNYIVKYLVFDANNNMSVASYTVQVS